MAARPPRPGHRGCGRPDAHRQAGALLRLLHEQPGAVDAGYEARETARALVRLDQPHWIAAEVVERLRTELATWPVALVPTHGDWQPRNWLVAEEGVVRAIDLGRAALRPAVSDLVRLAAQEHRGAPDLEAACLAGYGTDPREPGSWHRHRVREAIGTAVWAHAVGDEAFERQGLRMIGDALGPAGS